MKKDKFTKKDLENMRQKCLKVANDLYAAFAWEKSREGRLYWRNICHRVIELADLSVGTQAVKLPKCKKQKIDGFQSCGFIDGLQSSERVLTVYETDIPKKGGSK